MVPAESVTDISPAALPHREPLTYAFGGPVCTATVKQYPRDFVVVERLPFEADGEGHHWLVEIEKTDLNTLDMLDAVARRFNVARKSMGYSGLKDRFAVTRQFITLPSGTITQQALESAADEHWKVIGVSAHRRKLRVGSHRQNAFEITLRQVPQEETVRDALEQRLKNIKGTGVPNYFGPQRFGNDGSNLRKARQMFEQQRKLPRQQHRFAVSAARSWLFNAVLERRVQLNNWNALVQGEAVNLDGSSSWFAHSRLGPADAVRFFEFDLHPSGPMWGAGESPATDLALQIESDAIEAFDSFTQGLAQLGLKQERRALRQHVRDLTWMFENDTLTLRFALNKGGFATSVLRELVSGDGLML